MSGQCTGWVMRHGPTDRAMRAVLLTIADAANADGEHAHPGIEAMQRGSLYSRRSVFDALDRLVADGWIDVEEEGGGRGKATVYRVLMRRRETVQSSHSSEPVNGAETVQPDARNGAVCDIDTSSPTDTPNGVNDNARAVARSTSNADVDVSWFDKFWSVYPRRVGKGAARKAWDKVARHCERHADAPSLRDICNAAWRYANDPNLPELQFVPHPATWLNQERWEDGPLPARTDGRGPTRLERTLANAAAFLEGEG